METLNLKSKLVTVFEELDTKISLGEIGKKEHVEFNIFGQSALLEAKVGFELEQSKDIDAYTNASNIFLFEFNDFLKKFQLSYDSLSREAWMPPETVYRILYEGDFVTARIADLEYIIVSKIINAPTKNRMILINYLNAGNASVLFKDLVKKYNINLEKVINGDV